MLRLVAPLALLTAAGLVAQPGAYPPPTTLGPVETYGANIQRAMTLMAASTPLKRNTVRVLFYGQSITAQDWWKTVADRLRRKYPMADLVVENRAIPGFPSDRLVKTAEADLYPFYPDLVIFHAYGPTAEYEAIVRRIRERTTADILIATDHVAPKVGEKLDEETDAGKTTPALYGPWRNGVFLPAVARTYATDLADVRTHWKRYALDHRVGPSALLLDDLHLNARGNFLMAEIISAHLRHRPELTDDAWKDRVTTHVVGADVEWKDGKLVLPFDGNRVELVCKDLADGPPAAVRIDGKKPSEFPELYAPTRVQLPTARWFVPPVYRVGAAAPRVVEDWTLTVTDIAADRTRFKFRVAGSVTGDDGEGESGKPFASKSGRVVIAPEDVNVADALQFADRQNATTFTATWSVAPLHADQFAVPAAKNPFGETVVVAAQGLTNGRHVLELAGGPDTPLAAIRVSRPPLGR